MAINAGLAVDPLADPECGLAKVIQHSPGIPGFLRLTQGTAYLTKNLLLADNHRVEPGGDREHVVHGALFEVNVEVSCQIVEMHARVLRQTA